MNRGFGIDATVSPNVIQQAAQAAEQAGYASFWLNGSPPRGALEGLAAAAEVCKLPLGVGVLPLNRRSIEEVIDDVKELGIPQERFTIGIGYAKPQGALAYMRRSVELIRAELDVTPIIGAFGPKMTALAGEIADAVIFTFWFAAAIEKATPIFESGAEQAGRDVPPVISYIRTALLPQAEMRLNQIADNYDRIPKFREMYRRHGLTAHDTIVTGANRDEILPGIEREETVLNISIIRAITADESAGSILELLEAARPTDRHNG